ncbi:cytochrome c [Marinobacter sediminum]|uniref:c-type cytochrome n=1 Tax=Marinobacter sediminum TaxID=256323 RepID=UPI0020305325|nr:cytochrome c [Marinobacter sediminum]MCM0613260.1 cytochrome c [Marinobacter sediminum]
MSRKVKPSVSAAILLLPCLIFPSIAFPADPVAGRKLAGQCKTCHGLDGIAKIPIAPNLAGESQIYIRNQLKAFRSGKREHEMMTVVARDLTDQQIADVAAWYESIEVTAKLPE